MWFLFLTRFVHLLFVGLLERCSLSFCHIHSFFRNFSISRFLLAFPIFFLNLDIPSFLCIFCPSLSPSIDSRYSYTYMIPSFSPFHRIFHPSSIRVPTFRVSSLSFTWCTPLHSCTRAAISRSSHLSPFYITKVNPVSLKGASFLHSIGWKTHMFLNQAKKIQDCLF